MEKSVSLSWKRISTYLHGIGMKSEADIERVREIFDLGKLMSPEKLVATFISNYIDSEGKEQYKDLWLFSENYVIEVLNFARVETPKAEITTFNSNLVYTTAETKNYKFSEKAQKDSWLHIIFHTTSRFQCDLLAAGQNCDALRLIFEQYIKGNLAKGGSFGFI